jgi:hypothetical protein
VVSEDTFVDYFKRKEILVSNGQDYSSTKLQLPLALVCLDVIRPSALHLAKMCEPCYSVDLKDDCLGQIYRIFQDGKHPELLIARADKSLSIVKHYARTIVFLLEDGPKNVTLQEGSDEITNYYSRLLGMLKMVTLNINRGHDLLIVKLKNS